jgi:hypothetical protein
MGQELALPLEGGAINAKTLSEALTPTLVRVLDESDSAEEAARRIAARPALLEECRDKANLVKAIAAPLSDEGIYACLGPLFITFGKPDFGSGRDASALAQAWLRVYYDALKRVPRQALEYAVSEHIRVGKPFMPKPSELNKLAEKEAESIRRLAWRVQKAAASEQVDFGRRKYGPQTDEDRAAVAELKEALRSGTLLKPMPREPRPAGGQHALAEDLRRRADD